MNVVHATENYEWYFDFSLGIGQFKRIKDGSLGLIEIGIDAVQMDEFLIMFKENNNTDVFNVGFDLIAKTYF